jgi:uncharacterized membrane protein HdeD (DUF308 family)
MVSLRGLLAVIFGILALSWPTQTATALVVLIALFILLDGALSLLTAARSREPAWGFGVFEGVLGVVIGLLALLMPQITAIVLVVLVGVWALVTGLLELVVATRLRTQARSEWLLGAAGALSILFAVAVFVAPRAGVIALAVIVGIYALLFGVSLIVYGFRLRRALRT